MFKKLLKKIFYIYRTLIRRKILYDASRYIKKNGTNGIKKWKENRVNKGYSSLELNTILFRLLKDSHVYDAIEFGEAVVAIEKKMKFMKVLAIRYKRIGDFEKHDTLIKEIDEIQDKELLEFDEKSHRNSTYYLDLQKFKKNLLSAISSDTIKDFLFKNNTLIRDDIELSKIIFSIIKDVDTSLSIKYGMDYFYAKGSADKEFTSVLTRRLEKLEKYEKILKIYKTMYSLANKKMRPKYLNSIIKYIAKLYSKQIHNNIEDSINNIINELPSNIENKNVYTYKIIFLAVYKEEKYHNIAINYAEEYLAHFRDSSFALLLSEVYFRRGLINKALNTDQLDMSKAKHKNRIIRYGVFKKLLDEGFRLPEKAIDKKHKLNKNVLYCLHNSLPYNSGGYATRSHGLAKGIQLMGWNIQIVSRLGYPQDKSLFVNKDVSKVNPIDCIDGIYYNRLINPENPFGVALFNQYLQEYCEKLENLARELDISIIHGASNFINGIAANYVARKLRIKSIYEIRGLWEITRISRQPEWGDSDYFKMVSRLETEAANNADAVITITHSLKNLMISRGVPESKISVISNGVNTQRFLPRSKDVELAEELKIQNKTVIGYIGSVVNYEGLEYLVKAANLLITWGIKDFVVIIVGDGNVLEEIKSLSNQLGLSNIFHFIGRVPHESVESYYSLVDIAPFPRKGVDVCEIVSPLKPFEAMSMEKAVVASDVNALKEIIDDNRTGLLFEKDNPEDLAYKLKLLIKNKELVKTLGRNARTWVKTKKDWKKLSGEISKIYDNILSI